MTRIPKELKEIILNKENISNYFPNGILVDGHDLFDSYMDFLNWMSDNAETLKAESWIEKSDDGDDGDDGDEVDRLLQESYLGYVPSEDMFITGYDMWEGDDNPAGIVNWKLQDGKFAVLQEKIEYSSNMMYGKRGHYPKLHTEYSDLVDLRLD